MAFLDPKTDFAFKKIFGSIQSKEVLREFLNAMLHGGEEVIIDLEILDPYQPPPLLGMKDTFLDVRAKLNTEELVLIEMQVLHPLDFNKRVLYNAAKAYSTQLKRGQGYTALRPVIALTIVDFVLFPERSEVISHYKLLSTQDHLPYGDDLELVFVELPKFEKPLEGLEGLTELWLFFLQQTATFDQAPPLLCQSPGLEQALQIAERANLSKAEYELLERQELVLQDNRNIVLQAAREGLAQGRQEGLQEGRQEGRQEGLMAGKREVARSLLGVLPLEVISEKTGLSVAELEALQQYED